MTSGWMRVGRFLVPFLMVSGVAFAGVSFDLTYAVGEFGIGRARFDQPVDVVEDRDEQIYVLDQRNNRVQVLDRRGTFVREWGGSGFSPGSFDRPSAIAIDRASGNLFVADTHNNRIQKFSPTGKLLMVLGRQGSSDGEFTRPTDVAIDRRGNIYVADSGNDRIQKFDPTGQFLSEWGRFARRRGAKIGTPVSVAYSDEGFGCIYVLSMPDCQVQKLDVDGSQTRSWFLHRKGEGAQCGPGRIRIEQRRYTVYIADTENDRVVLFDRDGEPLGELKEGKVPFKKPGGLYINDLFAEDVIVADTGNNLIQKFRRKR